jgi:hypothetical protein
MEQLTPEGLKAVNELAQRYGFSQEAVIHMMFATLRGRGRMAQFNHPEFAGSGQWMGGGMLMLGDMFNHALKARVDGLCQSIAGLLASQPELFPAGSFQSQSQSGGGQQMQTGAGSQQMQVGGGQQMQTGPGGMGPMTPMPMSPMAPMGSGGSLFVADPRDTWWPKELGTPSATGSQNEVRYALFPGVGRLAVEVNGQVSVYDTGGHHIAGFSQQQGPGGAVVFTTPSGSVSLSSLSAVAGGSQQQQNSGGGQQQQQVGPGMTPMTGMTPMGGMRPMAPMDFGPAAGSAWWPPELGSPSATGAQNDLRYAVFPEARRLAVEVNGRLAVHDTGEHRITGCSQQDAASGVTFTTPTGTVRLDELPPIATAADGTAGAPSTPASPQGTGENDVLAALERLGELKQRGILSEEEFTAKKTDLLSRL